MQCKNEKRWNIFFFFLYPVLAAYLFCILYRARGDLPTSIPVFDLVIITLAIFRLIRLFVYDRITKFIRDWFEEIPPDPKTALLASGPTCACDLPGSQSTTFHDVQNAHGDGDRIGEAACYKSGFGAALFHLLSCPWCMGVWLALPLLFFYFLTPLAWLPILILALASVASFLQLVANLIGWSAEEKKRKAERG